MSPPPRIKQISQFSREPTRAAPTPGGASAASPRTQNMTGNAVSRMKARDAALPAPNAPAAISAASAAAVLLQVRVGEIPVDQVPPGLDVLRACIAVIDIV